MGSILKQFRHTVKLGTTRLPRCVFPDTCYAYGEILLSENKEEEALAAYIDAGEHAEAQQRIREIMYQRASNALAQGRQNEAALLFRRATGYKDAQLQALQLMKDSLLAAGSSHSAALRTDGTVLSAGAND